MLLAPCWAIRRQTSNLGRAGRAAYPNRSSSSTRRRKPNEREYFWSWLFVGASFDGPFRHFRNRCAITMSICATVKGSSSDTVAMTPIGQVLAVCPSPKTSAPSIIQTGRNETDSRCRPWNCAPTSSRNSRHARRSRERCHRRGHLGPRRPKRLLMRTPAVLQCHSTTV